VIILKTNDKSINDSLRLELKEYMRKVGDITEDEKKDLHEWVSAGNSVYDNPCLYSDDRGDPMDFISAIRMDNEIRMEHEARLKKRNATKIVLTCMSVIRKSEEIFLEKAINDLIDSGTIDVCDFPAELLDGIIDLLAGAYDEHPRYDDQENPF